GSRSRCARSTLARARSRVGGCRGEGVRYLEELQEQEAAGSDQRDRQDLRPTAGVRDGGKDERVEARRGRSAVRARRLDDPRASARQVSREWRDEGDEMKALNNVTIPKTTYRDLAVGSHLTVRLPGGEMRDALVERVGAVERGWSMLTLTVAGGPS